MSTTNQHQTFPLEGRDLARVTRKEIAEAILNAPLVNPIPQPMTALPHPGETTPSQVEFTVAPPPVARISSSAVVKYGRHVQLCEARNMQWVAENTSIPVPKVFDAWEADDKTSTQESTCYIVMEYIEGRLLSDAWDDLDSKLRSSIADKTAGYIRQLRSVKMNDPGPMGGGLSDGSFFTDYGAGPFKSREEIESWFNERLQVCHDFGKATHLPSGCFTGEFESLVMCHMDIHPRNLILDDTRKLWLIDWAFSGAYPPYFETAIMIWGTSNDFNDALLEIIRDETYRKGIDQLIAIGFALTTGAHTKPRTED